MAEQNRTDLNWEDVRIFLALARHGTLSAAGRAISLNHATIARRLKALEMIVGERLAERRPDGYVLTPAGTRILASANEMETVAANIRRGGTDDTLKGLVRVNAPPSLAHAFLVKRLAKLSADNPGLDIDLAGEFRNVSLERRETDLALRYTRPLDGDVVAKPLVSVGFGFYATAQLCSAIKRGAAPVFVAFDEANSYLPEAQWLAGQFPGARVSFRSSSGLSQAEAARVGAGVALVPHFIGRSHKELIQCHLGPEAPSRPLFLISRRNYRKDAPVRIVADCLTKCFAAERQYFEGGTQV